MAWYRRALLTISLLLMSATPASAQAFRLSRVPLPPGGGGGIHFFYIPHFLFRGVIESEVGQVVLIVLGILLLALIGWAVGCAIGERRGDPSSSGTHHSFTQPFDFQVPKSHATPDRESVPNADVLLDPSATAPKTLETRILMESLSSHDRHIDPAFLDQRFRGTFHLVQQGWEDRTCEYFDDLLTPRLFARFRQLIDGMRQNHQVNRLEGLRIENLEFLHLNYPEDQDAQEVSALITFCVTSYYLDERTGARCDGETSPRRFQECWTFRRNQDCWKLQEVEQSPQCSRLDKPNKVAGIA
jgi:predicted lipid-binding transport protein (Tim44 family)